MFKKSLLSTLFVLATQVHGAPPFPDLGEKSPLIGVAVVKASDVQDSVKNLMGYVKEESKPKANLTGLVLGVGVEETSVLKEIESSISKASPKYEVYEK